jgi:hypothetical protein
MQIGVITVDGQKVGVVTMQSGPVVDPFVPDLEGYEPHGRADRSAPGAPSSDHAGKGHHHRHGGEGVAPGEKSAPVGGHRPGHHAPQSHPYEPGGGYEPPAGKVYPPAEHGTPLHRQGTVETDQAIRDAAAAHHLDVNTMRGIASIESGMNPSSNANRATQYKGLYQIGSEEWRRFGDGGNVYSARENAMGAARMFDANRNQFREHFGRDPTDAELYMMHQQGLGFYTRGAMTNIGGNPYPGMRGAQTHESFEAGWGRELARRKAAFEAAEPKKQAPTPEPRPPGNELESSIPAPYQVASLEEPLPSQSTPPQSVSEPIIPIAPGAIERLLEENKIGPGDKPEGEESAPFSGGGIRG